MVLSRLNIFGNKTFQIIQSLEERGDEVASGFAQTSDGVGGVPGRYRSGFRYVLIVCFAARGSTCVPVCVEGCKAGGNIDYYFPCLKGGGRWQQLLDSHVGCTDTSLGDSCGVGVQSGYGVVVGG